MKYIIYGYWWLHDKFSFVWKKFKNKFGIPNMPKALPMRVFSDGSRDDYCWEDWHDEARLKYPFKHWLFHEFNIKVSVFFKRWIEDPLLWIDSRFFKKDHILDLRGAPIADYRRTYKGGSISPSSTLEAAIFATFNRILINIENKAGFLNDRISKLEFDLKKSDIFEEQWISREIELLKTIRRIGVFLYNDLPEMYKIEDNLYLSLKGKSKKEKREIRKNISEIEKDIENKKTSVYIEFINIREKLDQYD